MPKAVLIIDMPESCDMCDFADDTQPPRYGERTLYCNAPGTAIETVSEYANLVWKIAGWNVCLDEILK